MPDRPTTSPLLVRLRYGRVLFAMLVCGIVAVIGLRLWRRVDFDDSEEIAMFVLGLTFVAFWLLAVGIGLVLRNLVAGHALRLDAAGLHLPGWDVVPWPAIRSADLTYARWPRDGRFAKLVLDIDEACQAHRSGSYERWLWGPVAGLRKKKEVVELSLFTLAIPADRLLDAFDGFMGQKQRHWRVR